jgi:hypothetical protein
MPLSPRTFVRDVAVATLVLVGLYGLGQGVQFQLVQIPGYLLIVGFDALESVFGSAGPNYDLLFAVYILGLGVIGAAVSMGLREQSRSTGLSWWRFGVAETLAVVGFLSILFGAVILAGTSQLVPVVITGITGLGLLLLAAWLAGLVDSTDPHG